MKKLSVNLILITAVLFLCTDTVEAGQNSAATVHIDVDTTEGGIQISRNVAVGEIFDVDIVINGAVNLKIFNLVVTFPQALLEIQEEGVTQGGDLFPTLGFFEREFGTPGKVEVTGGVMSDDDAVSGAGVLFHLRFKALSDGQANLQFLAADTQVLFDNSSGFDDPVLLGNSDDGTVYIGDVVDPDQSTVEATSPVPVGETSTITITAKDADGNPIPGISAASIEVSSSGTDYTITPPTTDTDASGQTTAAISSTVAETMNISVTINGTVIGTASVTFTAGGVAPGQSSVDATTPVPVGGTSTITITAKDAYGNPIPGILAANIEVSSSGTDYTITPPAMPTNASGQTTATISSTKAETKTISVTINGTAIGTAPVTFTPGDVDAGQSSVVATTPVPVGETSTITITAKDADGNPIPGISATSIEVSSSGTDYTITPPAMPTNASGQTTAAISSTVAETMNISVTINGTAIGTTSVTFTPGGVSAAQSSVDATTPVKVGETSTITITAKDAYDNPIPGISPANIVVSSTNPGDTIVGPTTATDASGQTTATISSTKAETKTISVTIDGTAITDTAVVFEAGDPFRLDFTTSPGETAATAILSPSPQVTVLDKYGNLVTSGTVPVTLKIKDGTGEPGALLSGTTTVNSVDGVATFGDLTIDLAGTGYRLTAKSGTLASDDSEIFDITAEPVLTIEKSGNPDPVDPEGTVEYKITYGNTGLAPANNIIIAETLPANLTYVGSTDNGVYDEATGTITWTIDSLGALTTGKVVYFTAQVSDTMLEGGTIVNSNLTIDCDETEPVGQIVPETTTVNDKKAPATSGYIPEPDSIQVARDTIIQLHITDGGSGVKYDGGTVKIYVEGDLIYDGSNETPDGVYDSTGNDQVVKGICRRVGTEADYMFIFQSLTQFDYEQQVDVEVSAEDEAGNILSGEPYHFHTVMRSFGNNIKVNSDTGTLVQNRPATATDSAGNIWVVWDQTTAAGNTDIYIGKLSADGSAFEESMPVFSGANDQLNPAIAIDASDVLYVVWEESSGSNWDILLLTSEDDGITWTYDSSSEPFKINADLAPEVPDPVTQNPAIAISGTEMYVTWEETRAGNKDIWVKKSDVGQDPFDWKDATQVTNHESSQTEPVVAVDIAGTAYIAWTDARNATTTGTDIYGAMSTTSWSISPLVNTNSNQSSPAGAVSEDGVVHLLWVDDENGYDDIFYGNNDETEWPITGASIVDEPDTIQGSPAITANGTKIFACWQDARWIDNGDVADIYFTESGSGFDDRTNILVNDDGVYENTQTVPDIGDIDVDIHGNPYIVWVDDRNGNKDIYYAGATSIQDLTKEPVPVPDDPNAKTVPTTQANLQVTIPNLDDENAHVDPSTIRIGEVRNLSVTPPEGGFGLMYNFGPSGLAFDPPATIRIPLAQNDPSYSQYIVYWWDSTILPNGAWTTDGIHNPATKSSDGTYLEVQVDHFSVFQPGGSVPDVISGGGGGGGGCAISPNGQGNVIEYMLPYVFYVVVLLTIKLKDARNRKTI